MWLSGGSGCIGVWPCATRLSSTSEKSAVRRRSRQNHENDADHVELDHVHVSVQREREDRAKGDKEDPSADTHERSLCRYFIVTGALRRAQAPAAIHGG
jgi:hypothetical protein